MLALLGWLFIAGMTLLALRNYLSNLRQHALLSRSTDLIRQSEEEAKLILDTAPLALLLVNPEPGAYSAATLARAMLQLPPRAPDTRRIRTSSICRSGCSRWSSGWKPAGR